MFLKLRLNQPNRKLFATLVRTLFGAVMAILISALIDSLNAKAIAQVSDASPSSDQVPIWVLTLFWVLGLVLLCHAIITAMRAVKASNWPTVEGTITGSSLSAPPAGIYTVYEVMVRYEYTVDGQEYTGCRVAFGYGGRGNTLAPHAIHRIIHGASSVTVRYNPQNPKMSTLSCGINNSIMAIFAAAFFWLAVGVLILTQISWMLAVVIIFVFLWMWLTSRWDQVRLSNIEMISPPDENLE